jgi:hypothetical protein
MGLLHSGSQTNVMLERSVTGHCGGMRPVVTWYQQGRRERVWAPIKKNFGRPPPSPAGVDRLKNLYTTSERPTVSCKVAWALSERVNLDNRQIMIQSRKTKTCNTVGTRALFRMTGFPLPQPLVGTGYRNCDQRFAVLTNPLLKEVVPHSLALSTSPCRLRIPSELI